MHISMSILADQFALNFSYLWLIVIGTTIGIIIGAMPGFGAANTIILLLPFTLAVHVDVALIFMISLFVASHMGGGITSILLNIPGNGGAAATCLDGYPMARKGLGQQALVLSFVSSTVGGMVTAGLSIFLLPYISRLAYYMHSVEMVVVLLFGITLIASVASDNMLKGLIAGFLGLLIGAIGADHIYSTPRATFGFIELYDGVPLIAVLIGVFAISEALTMMESSSVLSDKGRELMKQAGWKETWEGVQMAFARTWHMIWTSLVGLVIGIIPGAGASIAAFVAYQQSRLFSKTPEKYGTGIPEGVIAPESANNGCSSGDLIPLLVIGVPGGTTAAVMLIVLTYHGVQLGPRLFIQNPGMGYGVFVTMMVAYAVMLFTTLPLTRYVSRLVLIPTTVLAPIIIAFTLVGAFAPRGYMFDLWLTLVFGVIGYLCRRTGYNVVAVLIGVILGPMLEANVMRALRISGDDPLVFFSSPVGNVLWVALACSLLIPSFAKWRRNRAALASA
ncbi:tripartite tricarboxylate transporter permease [Ancylobacter sp. MQZ15Z-1]|uniref:Tripartite tricarboxylate transporter permease n=1 Tax=Ancylobacter mangrovi TaxID=2972472 RepID=A0A9X2T2S4_9HYPH|nr:tripartite tricarboxylate transporter permease [Ancylobacter mangrovi]MCS0496490.1 tripartite tricarboxylate transporter permease [Ancylobacter mangrovi]